MKEVLVLVPCRERHREQLRRVGECRFVFGESLTPEQRAQAISCADAIIGEPDLAEIKRADKLAWIQMTWAGTDKYTCIEGFPREIALTTASGAFGAVIAEYVFGGILSLYRRFPAYRTQQQRHIWRDCGSERTIEGSRVLILGAGDIGENLAVRFQAFGAYVSGIRRSAGVCPAGFDEMTTLPQLEPQLAAADIVIGCLPNTPQTRHLLGAQELRQMKPNAVLVNVGRGSLIRTEELAAVLREGHLLGAVLDVTEPEPLPETHPLWDMDNVLLTPHIAGPSLNHAPQTEDKIFALCCDNLRRWLAGQPLRNRVDWESGCRGDSAG
jgi:phosphoglycerate dehydrogenase-like enzyme